MYINRAEEGLALLRRAAGEHHIVIPFQSAGNFFDCRASDGSPAGHICNLTVLVTLRIPQDPA
jgi:hypothetical protein